VGLQGGLQLPQGPLQALQALAPAELWLAHRVFGSGGSLIQIQAMGSVPSGGGLPAGRGNAEILFSLP
jgi:hypothetical protein